MENWSIYDLFQRTKPLNKKDIKIIITKMSKKYRFVKILEFDWESYVDYEEVVDIDLIKKVNIYFEGQIKFSIEYQDFNIMFNLFQQCHTFFLQNIQKTSMCSIPLKIDSSIKKPYILTPS